MKILMCQFGNETNTFASGRLDFNMLVPDGWVKGTEVISKFSGTSTFLGGALKAMEEEGVVPLPIDLLTNNGNFGAGPLMSEECCTYAMDSICEQISKLKGQFDGIYFAMHGAGVAENADDLEAYTLERVREVVGNEIPIMSSLDLHGNITEEMVALSDGLFGIKEVPHNDCFAAGYLAAKTLIAKYRGYCNPKMALRRLPLLIPPSLGSTLSGTAKEVKEYFEGYAKEHNLIDATFFHGFSPADRTCSSASVLVVADGYVPNKEADKLARYVWERHRQFVAQSYSAGQAVDIAISMIKSGYVVINEASDNPGGGCPGDGTHLLREFIERDLARSIMGPIYDPEAAEKTHKHRVGDRINITVGGKTEPINGEPLELKNVQIINLSDGNFVSAAPINKGVPMKYGKSARLRHGNVEFIVVSRRFQVYDDRPFIMTGVDMSQYSIVGLKSMNHFRGYFAPRADGIVAADTPGICPTNLKRYDYKNVIRPIFPLDENVAYDCNWPKK